MTLLLAGSSAVLIFTGCSHQLPAESSLPVKGSVCHVLQPEDSHKTYFDIVVGTGFSGKLPDDVDSSRQIYSCRTPTFSWPALKSPGPLYYQLQIRDLNRRYVYRTDYVLKHIMTMTAGIDWDEITFLHPNPRNPNTQMYTAGNPIGYVLNKKQIAPPGGAWRYNSGLTILLEGIIKNATKESDFFRNQKIHFLVH